MMRGGVREVVAAVELHFYAEDVPVPLLTPSFLFVLGTLSLVTWLCSGFLHKTTFINVCLIVRRSLSFSLREATVASHTFCV